MNRVTFGVASSLYLAVQTLQQAAPDFDSDSTPKASWHVHNSFYVDDLLGGADTVEQALDLYHSLRSMLGKGGFELRKWRSSSAEVISHIPKDLLEPMPTQDLVDRHSASYPKALGVVWDSDYDTMATHVELPASFVSSKRGIISDVARTLISDVARTLISDVARTFDVLGWLSPALPMKILFQERSWTGMMKSQKL